MKLIIAIALATAALAGPASAQQPAKVDPALVEKTIAETFKSRLRRVESAHRTGRDAEGVLATIATIRRRICSTPSSSARRRTSCFRRTARCSATGKRASKLAQRGTGGQFTDKPDTSKGGNCYACHQIEKKEVSYGTLGPSLDEYGKIRKFSAEEAKATYAKIYNAQSVQPCSNMPRFGHNKFLTEQNIKDLTAYLFDPESPVNK